MYIFLKEKQSKEKIRHTQQSRETKPLRVKLFSCNVLISAKLLEEHFRVNEANRSKPKLCLLFCAYFLAGKNDFKPNSQRRRTADYQDTPQRAKITEQELIKLETKKLYLILENRQSSNLSKQQANQNTEFKLTISLTQLS